MTTPSGQDVAGIIQAVAKQNGVTEEQVRKDMKEAMLAGMNNPDPKVQAEWKSFHYAGDEPTVEEFIIWMTSRMESKF